MTLSRPKRHTDKTGDISEAAIIARLLQSGYMVLTPYGKNHRYDLVIEDADGGFWRIQCKTGWIDEEQTVITFATASSYNHTAKQKGWRHYRGQCDYFAIYCEQLNKVYLVPIDAVGLTEAKLRLDRQKMGKRNIYVGHKIMNYEPLIKGLTIAMRCAIIAALG